MKLKILLILGLYFLSAGMFAETEDYHHHESEHGHHHMTEIGLSLGIAFLQHEESETAPGLHLHFIQRLGKHGLLNYLGIGFGFETIFAHHRHYNIMGTLAIFPIEHLSIGIAPGLLLAEEDDENIKEFALHIEAVYEFEIGAFAVGPALGYAKSGDGYHFTIGIHIGKHL